MAEAKPGHIVRVRQEGRFEDGDVFDSSRVVNPSNLSSARIELVNCYCFRRSPKGAKEKKGKMMSNLYVGSLAYETTEAELRQLFEQHGEVTSAKIITDRDTGRSKGFGFVEMANQAAAEEAIKKLNGAALGGRTIVVNQARPKTEKRSRY